jgi:hypothetical protein
MFNSLNHERYASERHQEMLRQAEQRRFVQQFRANRKPARPGFLALIIANILHR